MSRAKGELLTVGGSIYTRDTEECYYKTDVIPPIVPVKPDDSALEVLSLLFTGSSKHYRIVRGVEDLLLEGTQDRVNLHGSFRGRRGPWENLRTMINGPTYDFFVKASTGETCVFRMTDVPSSTRNGLGKIRYRNNQVLPGDRSVDDVFKEAKIWIDGHLELTHLGSVGVAMSRRTDSQIVEAEERRIRSGMIDCIRSAYGFNGEPRNAVVVERLQELSDEELEVLHRIAGKQPVAADDTEPLTCHILVGGADFYPDDETLRSLYEGQFLERTDEPGTRRELFALVESGLLGRTSIV